MAETSGNLAFTRRETHHSLQADELTSLAEDLFQEHGTVKGFGEYYASLERRVSDEFRSHPDFTRLAVQMYNGMLASHDDALGLYYHYTSTEGRDKILEQESINATGKSFKEQVFGALERGGLKAAAKAFLLGNNFEGGGIYATTHTQPETIRPNYTSVLNLFEQRLRALVGKSHSIGIPKEKLEYFFEIVSPQSAGLFKRTLQSHEPLVDIDEVRCSADTLSLGGNDDYLVLGPRENTFLKQRYPS